MLFVVIVVKLKPTSRKIIPTEPAVPQL